MGSSSPRVPWLAVVLVGAIASTSSTARAQGFTQASENTHGGMNTGDVIYACVKSDGLRDNDPDDGVLTEGGEALLLEQSVSSMPVTSRTMWMRPWNIRGLRCGRTATD
jgi:hypothetical protein